MRTVGKTQLNCFSPPVMLATCIIEIVLAGYVLWRYRLNALSRLVLTMLTFLALFQLAEYMVCGGWGITGDWWARIGYASITLLPPLGVHMAYVLAGRINRAVIIGSYTAAAAFMGYFLLATDVFSGNQCVGNYVIFQLGSMSALLYTVYYYGLLLAGIGLSLRFARRVSAKRRQALIAFIMGYVLFMLPTTVVNTIDPSTIAGIPSIMCGFAVMLAFVLSFWVLPLAGKPKNNFKK